MSRLNTALQNDLKLLALLRDETSLKVHLLNADLKARWQALEEDWDRLKVHVDRAEMAASASLKEAETAIGLLIEALRKGYDNIRAALKS